MQKIFKTCSLIVLRISFLCQLGGYIFIRPYWSSFHIHQHREKAVSLMRLPRRVKQDSKNAGRRRDERRGRHNSLKSCLNRASTTHVFKELPFNTLQ